MEDISEDIKEILDSLTEEEKALLPGYHSPRFPYALSLLLRMKGWDPKDIVKISTKICNSNFYNKLF